MGQPLQPAAAWVPIGAIPRHWAANLRALESRWPALAKKLSEMVPSTKFFIAPKVDHIALGTGSGAADIATLPNPVSPAMARHIAGQMFPRTHCDQPALVAGLDQGWLWDAIYKLPCKVAAAPGGKPSLYFLAADLERLWAVLHYQNWEKLLADPRVQIVAGSDAAEQFRQLIKSNPRLHPPRLSVTVDPTAWAGGRNFEMITRELTTETEAEFAAVQRQLWSAYAAFDAGALAERLRSGKLRILGITSRFTTFLQYSMRDWLASLESLGHETKLLIERADHERLTGLVFAQEALSFRPDLIVMIDHCRGEYAGFPDNIPFIMWIQDRMPHLYRPETGRMQKRFDYIIGYGRQELTLRDGYPAERFLPAMVGVNETRFSSRALPESQLAPYRCEVSFVSHASLPADQIIRQECERAGTPEARRLLGNLYQRLSAIYEAGKAVSSGDALRDMIVQAMADHHMTGDVDALLDLFNHRVNNALFRHQTIRWVAQMGVNLALYGNGWESHPEFARFARGPANNESQLPVIYQASAINLQVTPFGAVHQRLTDGLAGAGFFLVRSTASDQLEAIRRDAWNWCRKKGVTRGSEMIVHADAQLRDLLSRFRETANADPASDIEYFYSGLEEAAMSGFTRTVNTLFAEHDRVTFNTRDELVSKVRHFLSFPDERRQIADSMRRRVLETHTYTAISRRMLAFLADDLKKTRQPLRTTVAA